MPIIETKVNYEILCKTLNLLGYKVKGEIEPVYEGKNKEYSIFIKAEKKDASLITADYHLDSPNGKVLQAMLSGTDEQLSEIEKLLE